MAKYFRLENATVHAQKALMIVDPTITQEGAAQELVAAAQQARDAIRAAVDNGGGDLIGSADRLLTAMSQVVLRQAPENANAVAASAVKELDRLNAEIDEQKRALQAASQELEQAQEGFETRGRTLTRFLDELTNVAAEVEFQKQAEDYEKESKFFWKAGLFTLSVAACVALLPLLLNYLDRDGHDLDGQSFVSAHLAVALAFAAVSGVLLARARNRDRSRQRNRDLSVALITMFAYSEQIANDDERERFKHDMGRLVLEAFLRHELWCRTGSAADVSPKASACRRAGWSRGRVVASASAFTRFKCRPVRPVPTSCGAQCLFSIPPVYGGCLIPRSRASHLRLRVRHGSRRRG